MRVRGVIVEAGGFNLEAIVLSREADVFDVELVFVTREEDRAGKVVQTVNPEAEWAVYEDGLVTREESSGRNDDVTAALPVVGEDPM
jgi:hypothetical protein